MRRRTRRRNNEELAAAQKTARESRKEAERALAFQRARADDERENLLWPIRRLREVNHIAADIAYDLQQGGNGQ